MMAWSDPELLTVAYIYLSKDEDPLTILHRKIYLT